MKKLCLSTCIVLVFLMPLHAVERFRVHHSFPSKHLKATRNITVFLPADYGSSDRSYPVLYAHDGQNLFDTRTAAAGEWRMDENLDSLVQKKLLQGVIVVGVWNTPRRMHEYTPSAVKGKINAGGELGAYARFLVEELKPFIDKTYRTRQGRRHTMVLGSSLGGLASFYILGWYPRVFGGAGCVSPSFWWDKQRVLTDIKTLNFPGDVRLYIDGGWKEGSDGGMVRNMRQVYRALLARGLQAKKNIWYFEDPVGAHNESDWARRGTCPLLFLFGNQVGSLDKVRIRLEPRRLGIGDRSRLFAQLTYSTGIRATRFGAGFSALPAASVEIGPGTITATQAGKVTIVFRYQGTAYKRPLQIMARSRDIAHIRLRLVAPDKVKQLYFRILKVNGVATNRRLALTMEDERQGKLFYKGKVGTLLQFRIEDDQGRAALAPNGRVLQPVLAVSRDRQITLRIRTWGKAGR